MDHSHTPDWRQAEEAAARFTRSLGFRDARTTGAGADRGVDIVGSGVVAQVKAHASAVGRPDVQRLRGAALHSPVRLFFSTSGYSRGAIDYSDEAEVALFTFRLDEAPFAVNECASRLVAQRPQRSRSAGWQLVPRVLAVMLVIGMVVAFSPILYVIGREAMRRAGDRIADAVSALDDARVRDRVATAAIGALGSLLLGSIAVQNLVWAISGNVPPDGNPSWGAALGVLVGAGVLFALDRLVGTGVLRHVPLPHRIGGTSRGDAGSHDPAEPPPPDPANRLSENPHRPSRPEP